MFSRVCRLFDRQLFFVTVVVQYPVHAGVVVVAERASIVPLDELLCDSFVHVSSLFEHLSEGKNILVERSSLSRKLEVLIRLPIPSPVLAAFVSQS